MSDYQIIIALILEQYPATQGIYLFGSYDTDDAISSSDIDVAILLPVEVEKQINSGQWIKLSCDVAAATNREKTDLIRLRQVDTVFKKEIIVADRRIYCADPIAADEFEMLTLSLYQQLQEERKEIIEDAINSGRFRHA